MIEIMSEGHGDNKPSKPKALKGIKPVFSMQHGGHPRYEPHGRACPVFIDGSDVWLKHCRWIWSTGVAWIRFKGLLAFKPGEAVMMVRDKTRKEVSRFSHEDAAMMTAMVGRLNSEHLFQHPDRQLVYEMEERRNEQT